MESVVRLLAIGHHARGHHVHVAAVAPGEQARSSFVGALRTGGVPVTPLTVPGRAYLRERTVVSALCRELRPDVVHTHGYRPDVIASWAARSTGIPTVTTVHGFTGGGLRNRAYERLQQRAFRRFAAVVAVSRPLASHLLHAGVSRERLHVLPNAYQADGAFLDRPAARAALQLPAQGFRVGWVGRLSREKGPDVLVDAIAQLDDLPDLGVSIVGHGREWDAVHARAVASGAADRITWHGIVPDAGRLFRAFDVLVVSSRTEGTPMVVLEAMAAGVPLVVTRVGGIPDVLGDDDARLVASEDVAALATAIRAVHADPASAATRAAAARHRLASQFAVDPWLAQYEAIYQQVQRPVSSLRP
ncbi:MAG TPA: glycosyltransferase family 4 protein [Gemmatimonadaceae bacterium]|nr:glycosyltransferase family 4 protein [Gemmatimonadaceae bacterium]